MFQREPYIKREIIYKNYDHSPNAMEEVIQNIQERINESKEREKLHISPNARAFLDETY